MKDFASYTGSGSVPEDLLRDVQAAAQQYDGKNEAELIRTILEKKVSGVAIQNLK